MARVKAKEKAARSVRARPAPDGSVAERTRSRLKRIVPRAAGSQEALEHMGASEEDRKVAASGSQLPIGLHQQHTPNQVKQKTALERRQRHQRVREHMEEEHQDLMASLAGHLDEANQRILEASRYIRALPTIDHSDVEKIQTTREARRGAIRKVMSPVIFGTVVLSVEEHLKTYGCGCEGYECSSPITSEDEETEDESDDGGDESEIKEEE
ncbi:hypothetical protein PG995_007609 [Apiospora arundinis]